MRRFPDGFIYAGDSTADLHVWGKASAAIFAGRSATMEDKISRLTELEAVFLTKSPSLRQGLRIHQWAKNTLVFVPLILGGRAPEAIVWLHALALRGALSRPRRLFAQ